MPTPPQRGPGSNQHQDKPPRAPTRPSPAAPAVGGAAAHDPLADDAPVRALPPKPTNVGELASAARQAEREARDRLAELVADPTTRPVDLEHQAGRLGTAYARRWVADKLDKHAGDADALAVEHAHLSASVLGAYTEDHAAIADGGKRLRDEAGILSEASGLVHPDLDKRAHRPAADDDTPVTDELLAQTRLFADPATQVSPERFRASLASIAADEDAGRIMVVAEGIARSEAAFEVVDEIRAAECLGRDALVRQHARMLRDTLSDMSLHQNGIRLIRLKGRAAALKDACEILYPESRAPAHLR